MCVCVWGGGVCGCVCLAYTSEDFHMKTLRHTEDSTPSEDPKTGPRKTLAKNAENVMFYHLRGVRTPRTSMDFQPYLIYEDIRVLGRISKVSRCVCVCVCVCSARHSKRGPESIFYIQSEDILTKRGQNFSPRFVTMCTVLPMP